MSIAQSFTYGGWTYQASDPRYDGGYTGSLRPAASAVWTATSDYDHASPGFLQFSISRLDVTTTGTIQVFVERTGGYQGAVSCNVKTNSTTGDMAMTAGSHFTAVDQVVSFANLEVGVKTVDIPITGNPGAGLHMLVITMDTPTGSVTLRNPEMHIYYDDGGVNTNATLITDTDNLQSIVNAGSAGDLFYLRAGTYSDNTRTSGQTYAGYLIQNSGTQFAKVMITNYPGEAAVVDQLYAQTHDGSGEGTTVGFIVDCDYLHIKGIEITKCLHSGVMRGSGSRVQPVIENCHIHNLGDPPNGIPDYIQEWHADNIGGTLMDGTIRSIHRFNEIHDIYDVRTSTGTSNPWNAYAASGHSGIHGFYLEEAWMHHNTIYRVQKGIFQKNPDDIASDGLGHRIHHNAFSQCTGTCVALQFAGAGQPGANHVHVYFNLFDCTATGSGSCYGVQPIMPGNEQNADANDLWVYHNTKLGGYEIMAGGDILRVVVFNNVSDATGNTLIFEGAVADSTVAYCDYNCYYGGTFRVMTQRYSNTQTYNSLTAWRAAYPTDSALLRDMDENTITTQPTYVGGGDYRTTTGVTAIGSSGRHNRGIGIAEEVVGVI